MPTPIVQSLPRMEVLVTPIASDSVVIVGDLRLRSNCSATIALSTSNGTVVSTDVAANASTSESTWTLVAPNETSTSSSSCHNLTVSSPCCRRSRTLHIHSSVTIVATVDYYALVICFALLFLGVAIAKKNVSEKNRRERRLRHGRDEENGQQRLRKEY